MLTPPGSEEDCGVRAWQQGIELNLFTSRSLKGVLKEWRDCREICIVAIWFSSVPIVCGKSSGCAWMPFAFAGRRFFWTQAGVTEQGKDGVAGGQHKLLATTQLVQPGASQFSEEEELKLQDWMIRLLRFLHVFAGNGRFLSYKLFQIKNRSCFQFTGNNSASQSPA